MQECQEAVLLLGMDAISTGAAHRMETKGLQPRLTLPKQRTTAHG